MILVTLPTGMPRTSTELPVKRPGAVAKRAEMVMVEGPLVTRTTMPATTRATRAAATTVTILRSGSRRRNEGRLAIPSP